MNREDMVFEECLHTIRAYDFKNGFYLGEVVLSEDVEYPRYKNLCNGDRLLKIVRVETAREYTGCGVATALLNELFRLYPHDNFYLLCHPMPRGMCDDKHKTVKDLRRFYGKLGFVPCGELLPTMIRKASLPTLGE